MCYYTTDCMSEVGSRSKEPAPEVFMLQHHQCHPDHSVGGTPLSSVTAQHDGIGGTLCCKPHALFNAILRIAASQDFAVVAVRVVRRPGHGSNMPASARQARLAVPTGQGEVGVGVSVGGGGGKGR